MIVLAVLALHLVFGLGVALSSRLRGPTTLSKPLVFLTDMPAATPDASTDAAASHLKVSVARPRPPMPVLPAPPDANGVIVDAKPADDVQVMRICGAWSMQRGRHDDSQPAPSVLVRVDEDGRVTDSRFVVGSGSADRDAALQHCLLTLVRLTPLRLDGHAVAAWQKLNASRAESSRRP
jgi:hypothetical protein